VPAPVVPVVAAVLVVPVAVAAVSPAVPVVAAVLVALVAVAAVSPAVPVAVAAVVPDSQAARVVPAAVAARRARSVVPAVPRGVDASPSGSAVRSTSRCRRRQSAA